MIANSLNTNWPLRYTLEEFTFLTAAHHLSGDLILLRRDDSIEHLPTIPQLVVMWPLQLLGFIHSRWASLVASCYMLLPFTANLQLLLIVTGANSLLERSIYRFCHGVFPFLSIREETAMIRSSSLLANSQLQSIPPALRKSSLATVFQIWSLLMKALSCFESCHCGAIFYASDAVFSPRSICKINKPRGRIAPCKSTFKPSSILRLC